MSSPNHILKINLNSGQNIHFKLLNSNLNIHMYIRLFQFFLLEIPILKLIYMGFQINFAYQTNRQTPKHWGEYLIVLLGSQEYSMRS